MCRRARSYVEMMQWSVKLNKFRNLIQLQSDHEWQIKSEKKNLK